MRETVQVQQTGTADDMFDRGASVQPAQHVHELDFSVRPRRKVRVASLGGHRVEAAVHPVQARLPKPRARRNHGGVSVITGSTALQLHDLLRAEHAGAERHGLEIVQESGVRRVELRSAFRGTDALFDVRQSCRVANDWAGDAGDRGVNDERGPHVFRERAEDFTEAREVAGAVAARDNTLRSVRCTLEEPEQRFRPPDVSCQQHQWIIVNARGAHWSYVHLTASAARAVYPCARGSPAVHAEVGTDTA